MNDMFYSKNNINMSYDNKKNIILSSLYLLDNKYNNDNILDYIIKLIILLIEDIYI
jgi:hypothetical protein